MEEGVNLSSEKWKRYGKVCFLSSAAICSLFIVGNFIKEDLMLNEFQSKYVKKFQPKFVNEFQSKFVMIFPVNTSSTAKQEQSVPVGSECFRHFVSGNSTQIHRWYLEENGPPTIIFDKSLSHSIWPTFDGLKDDRIESQLLLHPELIEKNIPKKNKLILIGGNRGPFRSRNPTSQRFFFTKKCPFCSCQLTYELSLASKADAILFIDRIPSFFVEEFKRPAEQIWIFSSAEASFQIVGRETAFNRINWTATYRFDSELSTPYSKFVLFDPKIKTMNQSVDFAGRKSGIGKAAWFVSNCHSRNDRLEYAKKLAKFIPVDIFGECGDLKCGKDNKGSCTERLKKDYKFYLSFENRNCRWYVTEKLWTALNTETIPIVMGAPKSDYEQIAPFKSFIHVEDFPTPKDLALYLLELDRNDTAYNEYFQWKGTGAVIDNKLFCRMCGLLNMGNKPKRTYPNFKGWWEGACAI